MNPINHMHRGMQPFDTWLNYKLILYVVPLAVICATNSFTMNSLMLGACII